MTAAYTYGNALLRKDGETPLFDGLGSERTVTNTAGAVQGSLTLSAFDGRARPLNGAGSDGHDRGPIYAGDADGNTLPDGARTNTWDRPDRPVSCHFRVHFPYLI